MSYEKELAFAVDLAERAGQLMIAGFNQERNTTWKADNTPLTETDTAINRLVIESVMDVFPKDGVLGEEESYEQGRNRLWVVDPIDGTMPFDMGAPLSVFSLGFVEDGQVKAGLVLDPYIKRLYTAVDGQGAFMNDEPIRVSDKATLEQSYVSLGARSPRGYAGLGEILERVNAARAKDFRYRGTVYAYARVAVGAAIGAIDGHLGPWDLAAGKLIIEEAGGLVTNFGGDPVNYDQTSNGIIASNGKVHDQLLELVRL